MPSLPMASKERIFFSSNKIHLILIVRTFLEEFSRGLSYTIWTLHAHQECFFNENEVNHQGKEGLLANLTNETFGPTSDMWGFFQWENIEDWKRFERWRDKNQ